MAYIAVHRQTHLQGLNLRKCPKDAAIRPPARNLLARITSSSRFCNMHRFFPSFAAALVVAIAMTSLATRAAQVDSDDTTANPKPPQANTPEAPAVPPTPSATGGMVTGNSPEILLQLSDKPGTAQERGLDPGSRQTVAKSTETNSPTPQTEMGSVLSTLADLKKAFVGGTDEAAGRSGTDTHAPEMRAGDANTGTSDPAGPRAQRAVGSGLANHPVIHFVRENRGWVALGAVAIAIALWLTATMSSGRRR